MEHFKTEERQKLSTNIEKLAINISELSDLKKEMEEKIKELAENILIYERELAELLDSEGFAIGSKITLNNGRILKIEEYFSACIPSASAINGSKDPEKMQDLMDRKEHALKWLDDNNLGDVIKNQVIVMFQRGDNEKAKELMLRLQEQEMQFIKEESVHPMTLKATLKEAMKQGKNVPFDVFSVQTGTAIKIK